MSTQHNTHENKWLTFQAAAVYSGLNVRTLQNYARKGLIITSTVKLPGASRGRRLVKKQSIDDFIEAGIGEISTIHLNS